MIPDPDLSEMVRQSMEPAFDQESRAAVPRLVDEVRRLAVECRDLAWWKARAEQLEDAIQSHGDKRLLQVLKERPET